MQLLQYGFRARKVCTPPHEMFERMRCGLGVLDLEMEDWEWILRFWVNKMFWKTWGKGWGILGVFLGGKLTWRNEV